MERADPEAARIASEQLRNPRAHLPRSLVREGDGEDPLRGNLMLRDDVSDPRREHARLARARAGKHEQWPCGVLDGLALSGVKRERRHACLLVDTLKDARRIRFTMREETLRQTPNPGPA